MSMAREVEAALQEDGLTCADGRRLTGDLARCARIFSGGPVLAAVQQAKLFKDSKSFVDMPLLHDPEEVLADFAQLPDHSAETMRGFVAKHFGAVDAMEPWQPPDLQAAPPFLERLPESRKAFAMALNGLWATLGRARKMLPQQRCSALQPLHPTMVPGGRFRETYYWDTYWVVLGLLVCDMVETAKGVIANLLDLVRNFGFIPNGTRVYYLDRSQPPMLTLMALAVFDATGDKEWLAEVLPLLEKDYEFWMKEDGGHRVYLDLGRRIVFNIYVSKRKGPRPESYIEDLETAHAAGDRACVDVWQGLGAGAASGWDFTTRWLDDSDEEQLCQARLETIKAHRVIPVDLNCLLLKVEEGLARAHEALAHAAKMPRTEAAERYRQAAAERKQAIEDVLWNTATASYHDYHMDKGRFSKVVSLSNWAAPMWAGLHGPKADVFVQSLKDSGLLQPGGAASTAVDTKGATQWDAPNAWPPLQHMLVEGLERVGQQALAKEMAERWLRSAQMAWERSGFMYEKYDAGRPGEGGGGGEYEPQVGFGWSNGVALAFLAKWP